MLAPHSNALQVLVAIASFVIIAVALVKVVREVIQMVHKYRSGERNWTIDQ